MSNQTGKSKAHWDREFKLMALAKLKASGGNITATAGELGVPRQTLSYWNADEDLVKDIPELDLDDAFEVEIAEKAERTIRDLFVKVERILASDDTKLNEAMGALDKLHKVRSGMKVETPIAETQKDAGATDETVNRMLDLYAEALASANDRSIEEGEN